MLLWLFLFGGIGTLGLAYLAVRGPSASKAVKRRIELIKERHGEEDVTAITQDAVLGALTSILRALTLALAGIASVSLAVAGVGIMNVMLVSVTERTREIGVRMALGARPRDITGLFVRQGLWLAGCGVAAGIAAAWLLSRLMASLLFGVSATDPVTYVTVAAGLGAVTLLAGYLPARRAARREPVVALRAQG